MISSPGIEMVGGEKQRPQVEGHKRGKQGTEYDQVHCMHAWNSQE